MYTIKWYFSFPYLIHIFRTVHWKLELRAFTVYMYIINSKFVVFSFFFSCTVPQPKDGSLPGEKSWIPACPLDQQLSNFACPCQISVSFFFCSWQNTCLVLAHSASENKKSLAWQDNLHVLVLNDLKTLFFCGALTLSEHFWDKMLFHICTYIKEPSKN